MDLWIARRRNGHFIGTERVSLAGFEDIFEADLARGGSEVRMLIDPGGQEVALNGFVLPSLSVMRRTGRAEAISERVRCNIAGLESRLRAKEPAVKSAETASVLNSVAVLDALLRTRRPLAAIVVS